MTSAFLWAAHCASCYLHSPQASCRHAPRSSCVHAQVKWWRGLGEQGLPIYSYKLVRRPGQAPLLSKSLAFGGAQAPAGDIAPLRAAMVPVLAPPLTLFVYLSACDHLAQAASCWALLCTATPCMHLLDPALRCQSMPAALHGECCSPTYPTAQRACPAGKRPEQRHLGWPGDVQGELLHFVLAANLPLPALAQA